MHGSITSKMTRLGSNMTNKVSHIAAKFGSLSAEPNKFGKIPVPFVIHKLRSKAN